jgi:hypothetical protein
VDSEWNDQEVNASAGHDPLSRSLLEGFYKAYDIHSIRVSADADIRDEETSLVDIRFSAGEETGSYRVNFKLLGAASRTHRYLKRLGPRPQLQVELTPAGVAKGQDSIRKLFAEFVEAIRDRVAKIHKEQSILGIQPVGKSFLLYGKTRFEVLSDNGAGQLAIRIQREEGSSEAGMAANDLLDGLYAGVITRV